MGKTRNGIGFGYRTGMASKGSKLNPFPVPALQSFASDLTVIQSGDNYYFKALKGENLLITGYDFPAGWTKGFPYKSAATIDVFGQTGVPVSSLYQNFDLLNMYFCKHTLGTYIDDGFELKEPCVSAIVVYSEALTGTDLTDANAYFGVPELDAVYTNVAAADNLQAIVSAKNDGSTLYVKSANPRSLTFGRLDALNKNNYIKSIGFNAIKTSDGTHIVRSWALTKQFSGFYIAPLTSDVLEFTNGNITKFKNNYILQNCETLSDCLSEVENCIFKGNYNVAKATVNISLLATSNVVVKNNLFLGALHLQDINISGVTSGSISVLYNKIMSTLRDIGTSIVVGSSNRVNTLIKGNYIKSTKTISVAIYFAGARATSTHETECCYNTIICNYAHYKSIEFLENQVQIPYVHHNYIEYTYDGTVRPISFHSGNARVEYNIIKVLGAAEHGDDIDGDVQNGEVAVASLSHVVKNNFIHANRNGQTHINIGYTSTDADNKIAIEITNNKIKGYGTFNATAGEAKGILVQFQKNAKIRYNYLNGIGTGIQISGATAWTEGGVCYNLLINTKLYSYNAGAVNWFNNTLINSYNAATGIYCETGVVNNVFKNNIIILTGTGNCTGARDSGLSANIFDYNIYYCPNGTIIFNVGATSYTFAQWQALGYDEHSIVLTEAQFNGLFTDFANGDYSLKAGSVAIGSGVALDAAYDDGLDASTDWGSDNETPTVVTKQQGAAWDCGAYVH